MSGQRLSKKIFNICIVCIIIIAIIFIAMMLILNYDVNGETNMPFTLSKISIVSAVEGQDVEDANNKWNFNVNQNNDIYVYIEKNSGYNKQEIIASVKLDNFNIPTNPTVGEIKIYKPTVNDTTLFQNLEENEVTELVFEGRESTDMSNLQISNQGGVIGFRCANNNVGSFVSNDDEQINHNELLKKMNIDENSLKAEVSFDITIELTSGKKFKAENVVVQIPNENIVEEGTIRKRDYRFR